MCEQAKLYINQGYKAQRELLWDADEVAVSGSTRTTDERIDSE